MTSPGIRYLVDGQMLLEREVVALCKNVGGTTVRTRLLAGFSTLAELDAPPFKRGRMHAHMRGFTVLRPVLPCAVINRWSRPRDLHVGALRASL